jgi:hypothetical protein
MSGHLLSFGGSPYADISAVESKGTYSRNKAARKVERMLKSGNPEFKEVWPLIQQLPPDEKNYMVGVFCAWSYWGAFDKAVASGELPSEIFLAQDSGDWEFGDQYYMYEFSPLECRRSALNRRISYHKHQVVCAEHELKRLVSEPSDDQSTLDPVFQAASSSAQPTPAQEVPQRPRTRVVTPELDDIPF